MTDAEFDALHGGRELLPIEQVIYEAEGAERFASTHKMSRMAEHWPHPHPACEDWVDVGNCAIAPVGAAGKEGT